MRSEAKSRELYGSSIHYATFGNEPTQQTLPAFSSDEDIQPVHTVTTRLILLSMPICNTLYINLKFTSQLHSQSEMVIIFETSLIAAINRPQASTSSLPFHNEKPNLDDSSLAIDTNK